MGGRACVRTCGRCRILRLCVRARAAKESGSAVAAAARRCACARRTTARRCGGAHRRLSAAARAASCPRRGNGGRSEACGVERRRDVVAFGDRAACGSCREGDARRVCGSLRALGRTMRGCRMHRGFGPFVGARGGVCACWRRSRSRPAIVGSSIEGTRADRST